MTTSHTPGRLHVSRDVGIYSSKGRIVASAHSPIHQSGCDDARRLVACWNACEGIPTLDLEVDNVRFTEMLRERSTLKNQRDELLEVLKGLLSGMFDGPDESDAAALVAKARAAIAKAEGKA